MQIIGKDEK